MRKGFVVVAAVALGALAYVHSGGIGGHGHRTVTVNAADPRTAPMVVDGPSFSRSGDQETWSVYCVNPGAPDLQHATMWREVQVGEQGPDGPDGNWNKGRPCPLGKILSSGT